MHLHHSAQWQSELDEILEALPELSALAGTNVLITGVTGLIGSALADVFVRWNETHEGKIVILAAGRSQAGVEARFPHCLGRSWFRFVPFDAASAENHLDGPCDYLIHGAGNADPGSIVREPVETMLSSILGVKCLLAYAARVGAKRLLYLSSSEVYGQKSQTLPYLEEDYGYVDLLNPRNAYSMGKRAAETMCAAYAAEYGVDAVILRPGHIYGPTASEKDNRVSSQWAYAAARGQDIIMKSDGTQRRSYCHCLDCASAIVTVLQKGRSGQAYNLSNPNSILTIRQLAQILADAAKVSLNIEQPSEAERKGFNPMAHSVLDSSKLERLGWHGRFDAQRGLTETVTILKGLA